MALKDRFKAGALAALMLTASALPAAELLVEDFEGSAGRLGTWTVNFNSNGLGTTLEPHPFAPTVGGCPASPGHAGRIHGYLGPNRAPYSWAQLSLPLSAEGAPQDISAYKSLRFWVRGDGKSHGVKLMRAAVKDFDHFRFSLPTTPEWKELALPMDAFVQAGWGKPVARPFNDVTAVMFEAGSWDGTYDFQVDNVRLSTEAVELKPEAYDTTGWFPYAGYSVEKRRGTALDASARLDAPAGKHGWVKADGEGYAFADGQPVRFFGINLVAGSNFPSHEQADKLAEALAQMGVNLTRHHHADAPWATRNFFGKGAGTRTLDAENMDRFDYLVAQLQKRGIYQYFDLLVHRKALAADGVDDVSDVGNGWKIEGEFDPKLIELQQEFTRQLLGHKNPYTGKAYGKDPAVAMMELINEDSLYYRKESDDTFAISTPHYQGVYRGLFNAWLLKKYATRAALDLAWAPEAVEQKGLQDDEDPAKGTVQAVAGWNNEAALKALSPKRREDAWAFDGQLMADYYTKMVTLVRGTGYRGLLAGSNHWVSHPADLLLNAHLDFIDRHAYWGHPNGGWDYSPNVTFDPSPMVKDATTGVVGELAAKRVKGLPYIATEWGSTAPNDYRADGVLLMGAACLLQDWSAIQFAYSHTDQADFDRFKGKLNSFFDVIYQPVWMALWPTVATMVQRGDLKALPASGGAYTSFSASELADPLYSGQGTGKAAWAARTGVAFVPVSGTTPADALAAATKDGWVGAPGGQVRHNADRGLFVADAPRVAAIAGFLGAAGPIAGGALQAEVKNGYAVLTALSLDDAPLAGSKRVLITAGGNAVNTGMVKQWGGGRMAKAGDEPVLVEPVRGSLSLAMDGPRKVWALDGDGRRAMQVPSRYAEGRLSFEIGPRFKTLHYEAADK